MRIESITDAFGKGSLPIAPATIIMDKQAKKKVEFSGADLPSIEVAREAFQELWGDEEIVNNHVGALTAVSNVVIHYFKSGGKD